MNPVRLIILALLAYALYRLIFMGKKTSGRVFPGRQAFTSDHSENGFQSHEELMEDPVCHTYIPKTQAVYLKQDGQTYYFCGTECRDKFLEKGDGK